MIAKLNSISVPILVILKIINLYLKLPYGTNYNIEKFVCMGYDFLKEFRHWYYMRRLFGRKLNEHLCEVDEEMLWDVGIMEQMNAK